MELLVALLVVLGLIAIAVRFGLRVPSGPTRLPRIVDDSIGMWVLRRATGRPLLGRAAGVRPDPFARFRRPSTVLAVRARPRSAAAPTPMPAARSGSDPGLRAPEDSLRSSPDHSAARRRGTDPGSASATSAASRTPRRVAARTPMVRLLGYAGLAATVGVAGFVVGALLALASNHGSTRDGSRAGGAGGDLMAAPAIRSSAPATLEPASTTH